ncbi:hypothetical protein BgiMline_035002, partial [Biomphalaria glabrata]
TAGCLVLRVSDVPSEVMPIPLCSKSLADEQMMHAGISNIDDIKAKTSLITMKNEKEEFQRRGGAPDGVYT